MSLLADDVNGLTRFTDHYIVQDHGGDLEDSLDEIIQSLEKSDIGFPIEFAEPIRKLEKGWGKIFDTKHHLENQMDALQSLVFHMISGRVRSEIKIDVQKKIREIENELNMAKDGIEEMRTEKTRLISELKIEFDLPIGSRNT